MYNIRKKLWILALILFAANLALLPFSPKEEPNRSGAVMASSGSAESVQTENNVPLFGDNTEKFVAHRGYSGYAPENSIPAFELAGRTGFWGIETDISETNDGYFVCMHDDTLDRTTDGEGSVGDYSFEQIERLTIDFGNYLKTTENLKIPTMEEYLYICREYGCVAVVEIKKINNYDAFLQRIYDYGIQDRCIITGGIDDMKEIRARDASIPVMTISYYPSPYTDNLGSIAQIAENRGILYNYPQVEQHVVSELKGQNIYCGVWTIDDEDVAREYLDWGVDYVVTNEIPARLEYMINENE